MFPTLPSPHEFSEAAALRDVYFDFDRSALRPAESPKLDALAAKLKERKYARIDIVGHADRIGEAPHNDALSRKRADAAVAYLTAKGIDAARSHAEGKGESDTAIAEGCKDMGPERGDNEKLVACLQEDRRVDVAVVVE
jgi:OOP family OmpA-OmpF porin